MIQKNILAMCVVVLVLDFQNHFKMKVYVYEYLEKRCGSWILKNFEMEMNCLVFGTFERFHIYSKKIIMFHTNTSTNIFIEVNTEELKN